MEILYWFISDSKIANGILFCFSNMWLSRLWWYIKLETFLSIKFQKLLVTKVILVMCTGVMEIVSKCGMGKGGGGEHQVYMPIYSYENHFFIFHKKIQSLKLTKWAIMKMGWKNYMM